MKKKPLEPIISIDVAEVMRYESYMHEHTNMKSLNRHIKKWIKRKAPNTGVVLVSRDIMNRII